MYFMYYEKIYPATRSICSNLLILVSQNIVAHYNIEC